MPRRFILIFLVMGVLGSLPSFAQNGLPSGSAAPSVGASFLPVAYPLQISAGDLLDVNVFDTPELSSKLRVDARGEVALPVAGELSVSGMTAGQAGHAIEARFRQADVLKEPHVIVTVLEYSTQGVTVYGEVKNPGVYPLLGAHGVLDLISAAGGVTPNAGKAVTVTHREDPNHPVIVNIESKPGSTAAFNVDVRPGDIITVSRAGIVYVLGDVGKPGGFLIENNDRLTVMQAIALAQGTNRTASLNHAKLIRKTETGLEEMPVPLGKMLANKTPDEPLADGDILFVPVSSAKHTLVVAESILPAAAAAAVYHVP